MSGSFNDDLLSDKKRAKIGKTKIVTLVGGLPIHKTAAARFEIIVVL